MSAFVVDTSVIIQTFITETYSPNAEAFFDQTAGQDDLWAPEFCLLECANVLWKEVRFNNLPPESAEEMIALLMQLSVRWIVSSDFLPRALRIGLKHSLAIYDSIYIAMSERLGYPLVTVDQKQAVAARSEGITLKLITDFKPQQP